MSGCTRARELFGPYWDDETTRAEREWMDAHFAACAACRADYEALSRTLGAVAALPRVEAAPDLAERSLVAARRVSPVADRVFERRSPAWVPVAAAAAMALVAAISVAPRLWHPGAPAVVAQHQQQQAAPIVEPRLVAMATPSAGGPVTAPAGATAQRAAVSISDTLFDHTEDVDFVLDPVTLHRGRAHTVSRLPEGVRGEQAVISF